MDETFTYITHDTLKIVMEQFQFFNDIFKNERKNIFIAIVCASVFFKKKSRDKF